MNLVETTFRSPSSDRTVWTPFDGMDITCDLAIIAVTAKGDTILSTPSAGWTLDSTVKTREGNLQSVTVQTTTASFSKPSPSVESFEVDSTLSTVLSAIVIRITAS